MNFAWDNDNTSGSDAEDIGISVSRNARVESFSTTPPSSILPEVVEGHKRKTRENKCFLIHIKMMCKSKT